MTEEIEAQPEAVPCYQCISGHMQPRLLTYFTWLNSELITVPNFPAWVCDVCGRREYDEKAVSWLTMMLNPNAGKPTQRKRAAHRPRPQAGSHRPRPDQT